MIYRLKTVMDGILFASALLFVIATAAHSAEHLEESQVRLQQINQALEELQNELLKTRREANSQRQALEDVEIKIGQLQRSLRETGEQIALLTATVADLEQQQATLEQLLAAKEDDIAAILRLAYKQKNQPLIKLLLAGERPENLSRHLYYLSVLTDQQQRQLSAWVNEQNRLAENVAQQQESVRQLEAKQRALQNQQDELAKQKNRRAQVIANLEAEAREADQEIARKVEERERISELIAELEAQLATLDLDFAGAQPIQAAEGQLPWPVDGRLVNRYGRRINQSALTWQGWLLAAPDGEVVRAVHGGRIVFADFFKSNGLLIIIDHGDGIWTLYGRNQALLRDVGSWVEAGDEIAQVGRSGGYNESGLYFEVRRNGEPQNPANWLKNR